MRDSDAVQTILPRRLYLVLGIVGIGSVAAGFAIGGSDYLVNLLASITGFCAAAAVVAPLLAAFEARRLYPIWQLLSSDLFDDLLSLWERSFPSLSASRQGPGVIPSVAEDLKNAVEDLGLLRTYNPGLKPTWIGEQMAGPVETNPEKVLAHIERLKLEAGLLDNCRLDILVQEAEMITTNKVTEVLAVSYDAGLATGARELMAAVRWLTDTWWVPVRGADANKNLGECIRRLNEEHRGLQEAMNRGTNSKELSSIAGGATLACDEVVVLLDKLRWVLLQFYSLYSVVTALRAEKERNMSRWPFNIGTNHSLSGVIADAANEYKPVLIPRVPDIN